MVGLDVGDTHIAGAQLEFDPNGSMRLKAAGWMARPPNADVGQTAALLRQFFRRTGLSTNCVCAAFQSPAMVVKHYRHPRLTADEVTQALVIEAEETLQMPRDALYLDWHVNTPADPEGGTSAADGVLVAAPKFEIERHLEILARAGIVPVVVDAGCLAVCNLYLAVKPPPSPDRAVCLVALSNRRADIAVLSCERGIFPRTVFTPVAAWDESANYLTECVADTIKYHQFKLRGPPVERIYLTGTVPRRDVLVSHLRDLAPLMAFWNPVSDLTVDNPKLQALAESESGAILSTCLGLALRRI